MTALWESLQPVFQVLLALVPVGLWCVFWLLCVNWKKLWPVLAQGAWAGVVLLGLVSALVWSKLDDRSCNCLGFTTLPNFWWQLGGVASLIGVALFCGWLQGVIRYSPPDINVEMPTGHDAHGHGHGHGHHHDHAHGHAHH
jgi:hypothetical protein